MSSLIENGKLYFTVNSKAVSNSDFKRYKKIALEVLNEQPNAISWLNKFYEQINVCFFYEATEKGVGGTLFPCRPITLPLPPYAVSFYRGNKGYVGFFLKGFREEHHVESLDDEIKILFLEEFLHLVTGKKNRASPNYLLLKRQYDAKGEDGRTGKFLLEKLGDDREHNSVYSMILQQYPDIWVKFTSNPCHFVVQTAEQIKVEYEKWRDDPAYIRYTYLTVMYLSTASWLFLFEKAYKEKLCEESLQILGCNFQKAKIQSATFRELIENEMGRAALALIDQVNTGTFESQVGFFVTIEDLWKHLKLI